MDPLSDVIALLRPSAAVAKPIAARGRWGVRYSPHDAPGFTIVLRGEASIVFEDGVPIRLGRGDFILLPRTPAFSLSSGLDAPCIPMEPRNEAVRYGKPDGEPDFIALGGTFTFERVNAPLLVALLPGLVHIPASEGRATRLGRVIELLSDECGSDHPGKELIVHRLLEVLLVEALRWRRVGGEGVPAGLPSGMRDPALARALRAIHADVRAGWTVGELARVAGMSRSAFSTRFGETLGCPPIDYLARWRMAIAKDALIHGAKPLDRIANEIGYESASAFSTAFRKRFGCSPGRFARNAAIHGQT